MKITLLLFLVTLTLFASPQRKIILASTENAQQITSTFNTFIEKTLNDNFLQLQQRYKFDIVARSSGRSYILVLEPFLSYSDAKTVKKELPSSYKDAFINKYTPPENESIVAIKKATQTALRAEANRTQPMPPIAVPHNSDTNLTLPQTIQESNETNITHLPATDETNETNETNATLPAAIDETNATLKSEPKEKPQDKVTVTPPQLPPVATKQTAPLATVKKPIQNVVQHSGNSLWYLIIALILILLPLIAIAIKTAKNNRILKAKLDNSDSFFNHCFHEKEELLATLKSKDAFLNNLTYNLKTSINTILESSSSLDTINLNRNEQEQLEKITLSASKIDEVISNIMDIIKLRSNRFELEAISFNLNNILETTANSVHTQAQEKHIEITFDISTQLPIKFIGDPLRINQILTNILNHSINATDRGEIVISIKERKRTQENIDIEFTIRDTGLGYRQNEIATIFEEFSDDDIHDIDSNVKIGLVMSKHLIKKMGGDIELKSSYGHGSSFIFNLLLTLPKKIEQRKYRLPYKAIMNYTAVIIDNNILAARVLRQQLEYFHLKVKPSFSWEHAVKIINDEFRPIDFLIINSTILGETSIDDLAQTAKNKGFQIVFIVHDMRDINYQVIEKFKHAHFLHKPYTQKKLFDLLVKIHENNL
jgi:signal transduction histidine kinase